MEAFLSGGADDAKLLKGPSFREYSPKKVRDSPLWSQDLGEVLIFHTGLCVDDVRREA